MTAMTMALNQQVSLPENWGNTAILSHFGMARLCVIVVVKYIIFNQSWAVGQRVRKERGRKHRKVNKNQRYIMQRPLSLSANSCIDDSSVSTTIVGYDFFCNTR